MIEKRDPGIVLVLALFTCGFYLIYWYYKMYEELESLADATPTGNAFWMDFLLNIVTCGLFGIYVDYKMSLQLNELQAPVGITHDSSTMVIMLDVMAYFTGMFTNFISSAVHQDQLNKVMQARSSD